MARALGDMHLAAVGVIPVAVGVAVVTRGNPARLVLADGHGVGKRAGIGTCAAVLQAGRQVGLAAGNHVAVPEIAGAGRRLARAVEANHGRRRKTLGAALPAVDRVDLQVGLAAVRVVEVAVLEARVAARDTAGSADAARGRVSHHALVPAPAAMVSSGVGIHLAAVGQVRVAVRKPGLARVEHARAGAALGRGVREVAGVARRTAAAVRGIGGVDAGALAKLLPCRTLPVARCVHRRVCRLLVGRIRSGRIGVSGRIGTRILPRIGQGRGVGRAILGHEVLFTGAATLRAACEQSRDPQRAGEEVLAPARLGAASGSRGRALRRGMGHTYTSHRKPPCAPAQSGVFGQYSANAGKVVRCHDSCGQALPGLIVMGP